MATNYSQDVQSASKIMQRAVDQAERYIADAETEATRILTEAREQKAAIEAEAQRAAAEALATAQEEAAAITSAASERVADREAKVFAAEAMVEEKAVLILGEAVRHATAVQESAVRAGAYQQDILGRLVELFSQESAAITEALSATPALETAHEVDVDQFIQDVRDLLQDRATPAIELVAPEGQGDTEDLDTLSARISSEAILVDTENEENAR